MMTTYDLETRELIIQLSGRELFFLEEEGHTAFARRMRNTHPRTLRIVLNGELFWQPNAEELEVAGI